MLEFDDPLSDIDKLLLQFLDELAHIVVDVQPAIFLVQAVFVDVAGDLGDVQGAAAADGDNGIWCKLLHLLGNLDRLAQRRVRQDFTVDGRVDLLVF